MNFRSLIAVLSLLCVATLARPTVCSASILEGALTNGENQLNDVNRERIINLVGADPNVLDVGDILESVLLFDNINNGNGTNLLSTFPGLPGLTAYSRIEVVTKVPIGPLGFLYTFTGAFANGDAVQIFEGADLDDVSDFDSGGVAGNIADATSPVTPLFTLDLDGVDDFWNAIGGDNISLLTAATPVNYNFGLSVNLNAGMVPIVADGMFIPGAPGSFHDVIGTGKVIPIAAGAPTNGWQAASDTTVTFVAAVVPEPGTLLVWAGLLACSLAATSTVRRARR